MLSPSDFIAFFSATAGGAYSAWIRPVKLTDTFSLRFTISFQASVVFLLAFASTQYLSMDMDQPGAVPGVQWTQQYLTTSMPIILYLTILAVVSVMSFHTIFWIAEKFEWNLIRTSFFSFFTVLLQCMVILHALTLEVSPSMMDKLQ
jgi:hypothetical protein